MKTTPAKAVVLTLMMLLFFLSRAWGADSVSFAEKNWPQWRGPMGTGEAPVADPPVEWSESKNVKWKVFIPGKSHASPIVWGDTIFIVTAIPTESQGKSPKEEGGRLPKTTPKNPFVHTDRIHKFAILAIDRNDGRIRWLRVACETLPFDRTHTDGTWASNSPVTDGEHVFAYFGSRGLFCYDMKGNLKWKKNVGTMSKRLSFGEGSSPSLYGGKIVIVQDHEGQSFIAAFDKKTGEQVWRTDRDELTSWATPVIVVSQGGAQVVTSSTKKVRSYDFATGKLLWEGKGPRYNVIPTPVCGGDMVFLMSSIQKRGLTAIRLSRAKGDLSHGDAVAWTLERNIPETPSPLLYKGLLYFLQKNQAVLSCVAAKTGEPQYPPLRFRGVGTIYASPVGAKNHIYLMSRKGVTLVIEHGSKGRLLARNILDDSFSASPAIVGKEIILRGRRNLYCIAE
jgi:outer membrane protein assembly factor BamB